MSSRGFTCGEGYWWTCQGKDAPGSSAKPERETAMVVLSPGESWEKVMAPRTPRWLNEADTDRESEGGCTM